MCIVRKLINISAMTKWVPGWMKKGWKTAEGKPVINKEDFETLLADSKGVHINWVICIFIINSKILL